MGSALDVEFRAADAGVAPARDLIESMIAELAAFYGRIDGEGTPSASPADFRPPEGVFLVGWCGDEPVAGGGVKGLGAGCGEIKRMYVAPAWRGRGLGSALLAALEDAAAALGYASVRLDTGPRQPGARRMYQRAGYETIPDYNGNPHASFWGEKHLVGRGGA